MDSCGEPRGRSGGGGGVYFISFSLLKRPVLQKSWSSLTMQLRAGRKHSDFQRPDGERETYTCAEQVACSGAKATGSFTSAAGSGDGSVGASSSSASFTSHARSGSRREVAFGVLLPSLRQERRQLVGHKQMLPSSRGAICSVRILRCSVQKVQDVTPHCRLVHKLSHGIDFLERLR